MLNKVIGIACLLLLVSVTAANSYSAILNDMTPNSIKYTENGESYWKINLISENKETAILVSPNFIISKTNIPPIKEIELVDSYLFGLLVSYKGKEVYFNSTGNLSIEYRKMSNVDKFNNFFRLG